MSFVVVMHLSPDRRSQLPHILEQSTELTVSAAEDGAPVQAGHVHVMPAGAVMTIRDGRLRLTPDEDPNNRERRPIDVFLGALAEDQGENAAAVILSGGNSDGTLGAKLVKEAGGITMAQAGDGADFNPEMPESAISVGLIDFTETAEGMAGLLVQIRSSNVVLDDLVQDDLAQKTTEEARWLQREIAELLDTQTGHDFTGYKAQTFLRRVARRMKIHRIGSGEAYVERLRGDPAERLALFRDLLINVTGFFRDTEAFEQLRTKVIPRLFEAREPQTPIRVWVPGCATGEEVYSLAILMREHADTVADPPQIQIFATDIDETALSVARAGRYPEAALDGIDAARMDRFFPPDGATRVIAREVRDLCVFSAHNILSHPPFSRMDLVSCRNLLIYLGGELQDRVVPVFHYALRPGGYLFLGTSESISRHRELFATVDQRHSIYQSRELEGRTVPVQLPLPDGYRIGAAAGARPDAELGARHRMRMHVEQQVLDRHAPAHVAVTPEGEILYFSANTSPYLEIPRGAPDRQLLNIAKRDLRMDLRAALRDAIESGAPTSREVRMSRDGDRPDRHVRLTVEPLDHLGPAESMYLVVFAPQGDADRADPENGTAAERTQAALERELRDMRERLQSTVEEYETALEELKASNEELMSLNEESQSSNEELEASKEEMQSLNDQLVNANEELARRLEELARMNADLRNLYAATDVATVFLDAGMVIRNFSPGATRFFNLRDADIGRPLTELQNVFGYSDLHHNVTAVMQDGEVHERTLSADGRHHLLRVVPYREDDDSVRGTIVHLIEITALVEAEKQQENLINELNHRVKNMLTVVLSIVQNTRRNVPEPEDFADVLTGRLHGLSRAYTLLSDADWTRVSLAEVIAAEAEVHDGGRFDADGPDLRIGAQETLSLGMVLHELATNAMKYGALSVTEGRVTIRWERTGDDLSLTWQETGGPPIESAPEKPGFGLTFIDGQVTHQLGGTLETDFRREGLHVRLTFPL